MMRKTLIDLDVDLLEQVQKLLGTRTKKDTVNSALRELVRQHAAVEFLALAQAGAFDHGGQ